MAEIEQFASLPPGAWAAGNAFTCADHHATDRLTEGWAGCEWRKLLPPVRPAQFREPVHLCFEFHQRRWDIIHR
jgi:hypothetical protein